MDLSSICLRLKNASSALAVQTEAQKNIALEGVASAILKNKELILKANQCDVDSARASGMSESLVERLALDEKKFKSILDGIQIIIQQKDPVGKVVDGWTAPNGMKIQKVRVPLGVVAIIYESRPNVTVDAFALAYKSGNAILLRGSSSALKSNIALVDAIQEGLRNAGENGIESSVFLCQEGNHSEVNEILAAVGKIDVVLPRGSAKLINFVVENAKVPIIQTGAGVCHLFVDESADLEKAALIAQNAKMQRPGACNAIETILVHKNIANEVLKKIANYFAEKVQIRASKDCFDILANCGYKNLLLATEEDFGFEFLDFIVAIRTVDSVEQAIDFINSHNTKHSEAIVTNNRSNAILFQNKIDAACVYVNASTRFTDGGVFGFGAELGISTQKLHARGPMGAEALTTTKFLIDGDGQIR